MSVTDLIHLAQYGGGSMAVSLGVVLLAIWRGWLEVGSSVKRERDLLTRYGDQMKGERDGYKAQVDARQSVVDEALALAKALRDAYRHLPAPTGPGGT